MQNALNSSNVICPKCGSNNVTFQLVSVQKRRGCLSMIFVFFIKLLLFLISFVIWLISLLIPKIKKTKTKKYAVCQNCGNSWEFRN